MTKKEIVSCLLIAAQAGLFFYAGTVYGGGDHREFQPALSFLALVCLSFGLRWR